MQHIWRNLWIRLRLSKTKNISNIILRIFSKFHQNRNVIYSISFFIKIRMYICNIYQFFYNIWKFFIVKKKWQCIYIYICVWKIIKYIYSLLFIFFSSFFLYYVNILIYLVKMCFYFRQWWTRYLFIFLYNCIDIY